MKNHKIFDLLAELSVKELKQFKDFLNSPFFNKSGKIIRVFEKIIKYYPDFDNFSLTNEELHKELFPHIKYNDATMRHLFSDLMILAEQFLVQINLQKKPLDNFEFLLDEIYSKHYFCLLNSNLHKMDGLIRNGNKKLGSYYFLGRFKAETNEFNFKSLEPSSFSKKNINSTIEHLVNRSKYLVCFFIFELIKSIDALQLISKNYNINTQENFIRNFLIKFDLDKTLIFLKSHPELSEYSYLFSIYHKLYKAFANLDYEMFYFGFKDELLTNFDKFNHDEQSYLYKKLVDYCIIKNKFPGTVSDFDAELFFLYETMLKKKIYLNRSDKYISPDFFRNILMHSLKLKRHDWAEGFINNYSGELHPDYRNNVVNFSLASCYFERKEYETSLLFLNKLKLDNQVLKLDTKSLMLKAYFMLDNAEPAVSLISAYKEFLRKNNLISASRKNSHKNFILYVEKLINYKNKPEKLNIKFLRKDIANSNTINKTWLIEILDNINNQPSRLLKN